MAIINQTLIEDRVGSAELIRLTDDAGAGTLDSSVLAQAIADGEGEVLNNIGQRYVLPLALTNTYTAAVVKAKLLDVVEYILRRHREKIVDPSFTDAYKAAVRWSEQIAAGTLGLLGEVLLDSSPASQGSSMQIVYDPQVISRDEMAGL